MQDIELDEWLPTTSNTMNIQAASKHNYVAPHLREQCDEIPGKVINCIKSHKAHVIRQLMDQI